MTEEELEKEAEEKGVKYADNLEYTISKFSDEEGYCWSQVEQAYEKGALDFAEPREKRIAELELEIKKLTQHLEPQLMTDLLKQVREEVKQEQRTKKLEEENAELKASLQKKVNTTTVSDYPYSALKLEEAKEIITALLNVFVYDLADDEMDTGHIDTKIKAEQFLKEIE